MVSGEMQFLGGNTWNVLDATEGSRRAAKEFPTTNLKLITPNVSNALAPRRAYG